MSGWRSSRPAAANLARLTRGVVFVAWPNAVPPEADAARVREMRSFTADLERRGFTVLLVNGRHVKADGNPICIKVKAHILDK